MTPQFSIKFLLVLSAIAALFGTVAQEWILAISGLVVFVGLGYLIHKADQMSQRATPSQDGNK